MRLKFKFISAPEQCYSWPKVLIANDSHVDDLLPPDLPETAGGFPSSVPLEGMCGSTISAWRMSLLTPRNGVGHSMVQLQNGTFSDLK